MTRMALRFARPAALILGGGDAARLAPLLSSPVQLSEDSVLRGLAVWANTHRAAASPD